jgi:3-demethoxyubiquinol 3-hydroxylase
VQHLDQVGLMMSDLYTAAQTGASVAPGTSGAGLMMAPGHTLPSEVLADLRTDHAGETGAVCIYRGVLRFARDPMLRSFAHRHLATEQAHLQQIEGWLAPAHRSRLLPAWRLAGWLTGALPALLGPRAVYCTIETVEQFVDQHYDEQIHRLEAHPALGPLRKTLLQCQGDEVAHRDEAAAARGAVELGVVLRAWCWVVAAGSRGAVVVCRHI